MKTMNRATLIGRIGNEVVLRTTRSGKTVVNLSLATEQRRSDGERSTTWHRVVLWDKLAEVAGRFLGKGSPIYVDGPLVVNEWTDKEGVVHHRTEVVARELILLGDGGRRISSMGPEREVLPSPAADGEERGELRATIPF